MFKDTDINLVIDSVSINDDLRILLTTETHSLKMILGPTFRSLWGIVQRFFCRTLLNHPCVFCHSP